MITLALLALLPWQANRLWFVDLELRGPCDAVHFDCGVDGETSLSGPFARGEDRHLRVAVPVHSPMGPAELELVPFPRVELRGAGPQSQAEVRGWSRETGLEELLELRRIHSLVPPARTTAAHARALECWLALAALPLLWRLRARPFLAAVFAFGAATTLFLWTASLRVPGESTLVIAWEVGGHALAIETSVGALPLPQGALEVVPAGAPLRFRVMPLGEGEASARGQLIGLRPTRSPVLDRQRGPSEPLERVWIRAAEGTWSARGSWEVGSPLGATRAEGSAPPGWLASGIPAGRAACVAETRAGTWWRCLGFEAGDG